MAVYGSSLLRIRILGISGTLQQNRKQKVLEIIRQKETGNDETSSSGSKSESEGSRSCVKGEDNLGNFQFRYNKYPKSKSCMVIWL